MAGILLPGDWKQQPAQQRRLKPEFDRPAFLAMPGQLRPVVQSAQTMTYPVDVTAGLFSGNSGSTTRGLSRNGPGVVTTSGTGYQFQRVGSATDAYIETPSGADFTWLFQVDRIGYTGANPGFFRNSGGGGNTFVLIPSSGLWVRQNGSDFTSSIAAPAAGSSVTVVVSVRSGISVKAWINGVQVLNSTTATTTGDSTNVSGVNFLGRHSATEYLTGNHTLAGHWHRAFADSANRALSLNPWALFAPLPRRMLVSAAAGGGAASYTLTAAAGSFSLSGQAAALKVGRKLTAAAGSLALTGNAAGLKADRKVAAATGSFTLTGSAARLLKFSGVSGAPASFTLTGSATGLRAARVLSAAKGTYTLTGNAASLSAVGSYRLAADPAAFALTGQAAGLRRGAKLGAAAGSFALTGTAAALRKGYALLAGSGSFTVTGRAAGLYRAFGLHVAPASFTLTGSAAALVYSNAPIAETSDARTVYVSPEGRRYYIAPEGRTVYVAPEGRRVYVEPQGRTIEI